MIRAGIEFAYAASLVGIGFLLGYRRGWYARKTAELKLAYGASEAFLREHPGVREWINSVRREVGSK